MAWYWILLICLGYLLMVLVTTVVARLLDIFWEDELIILIGMFWPVAVPISILVFIFIAINALSEELTKKISKKIEQIQDERKLRNVN